MPNFPTVSRAARVVSVIADQLYRLAGAILRRFGDTLAHPKIAGGSDAGDLRLTVAGDRQHRADRVIRIGDGTNYWSDITIQHSVNPPLVKLLVIAVFFLFLTVRIASAPR